MTVINVEVSEKIATKFSWYNVVNFNELSMENELLSIDWDWWNDFSVNMWADDFLSKLKNDVINYKK